jgi:hypothetical protein
MSYESIDEASGKETFEVLVQKVNQYALADSPDIGERLALERAIKKYFSSFKIDWILNFAIECVKYDNGNNGHQRKES